MYVEGKYSSLMKFFILFFIFFITLPLNTSAAIQKDEEVFLSNDKQLIESIPTNQPMYFKDNINTNYYLVYKTRNYLSVIKIYIKSVKNYKIAYDKFIDDRFRSFKDSVTYIYKKNEDSGTFEYIDNIEINEIASNIYFFKQNAEILMQNTDYFQKYDDKLYRIKTTYFEDQDFYMFDVFLNKDNEWVLVNRFFK